MLKVISGNLEIVSFSAKATLLWLLLVSTCQAAQEFVAYSNDAQIAQTKSLQHISEGLKAILAMYALQTGSGCGGYAEDRSLECVLPKSLGLGMQCSEKHLTLVRSWFENGFPAMSIYPKPKTQRLAEPTQLESICYNSPDTSTVQENWEIIRVKTDKKFVFVNAVRMWTFHSSDGPYYRIRYKSKYRIDNHIVTVLSHKEFPLPVHNSY